MKNKHKLTEGQNNFFSFVFLLLAIIFFLSMFMTKNGVGINKGEKDTLMILILFCLAATGYFIKCSIKASDKKNQE